MAKKDQDKVKNLTDETLIEVLELVKSATKISKKHSPEIAIEILLEGKLKALLEFASSLLFLILPSAILMATMETSLLLVVPVIPLFCGIISLYKSIELAISLFAAPKLYVLTHIKKLITE